MTTRLERLIQLEFEPNDAEHNMLESVWIARTKFSRFETELRSCYEDLEQFDRRMKEYDERLLDLGVFVERSRKMHKSVKKAYFKWHRCLLATINQLQLELAGAKTKQRASGQLGVPTSTPNHANSTLPVDSLQPNQLVNQSYEPAIPVGDTNQTSISQELSLETALNLLQLTHRRNGINFNRGDRYD